MKLLKLLFIPMLLAASSLAWSQKIDPDDIHFEITKMDVDLMKYDDDFPNLKSIQQGGERDWLVILVRYKIKVDNRKKRYRERNGSLWIDECQFNWRVCLAYGSGRTDKPSSRYSVRMAKQVSYGHLKANGRTEYWAMLAVPPAVIDRFTPRIPTDQVYIELKIKTGEKTREEIWARGERQIKRSDVPTISRVSYLDSEEVQSLDNGLRSKDETPWASTSVDRFGLMLKTE